MTAALRRSLAGIDRYPLDEPDALIADIATFEGVSQDQIILGEVLRDLGLYLGVSKAPGAEVLLADPGFPEVADAAARVGGVGIKIPLTATGEHDLPAFSAAVSERTVAIFIVNPHNPTGTVVYSEDLLQFARRESTRTLVIINEAYLDYTDDFTRRTAVGLVREGQNVAVFRTFAKAYGLGGLQIGYLVAPSELAAALRAQGIGAPRSQNLLSVAAARAALNDQSFVSDVRAIISQERGLWEHDFHDLGLTHTTARGNFVFVNVNRPHAEFAAAMASAGVLIGRHFPPWDTWVRITLGTPDENRIARRAFRAVVTG